eukprot:7390085-Prymnesium_polylepis.3
MVSSRGCAVRAITTSSGHARAMALSRCCGPPPASRSGISTFVVNCPLCTALSIGSAGTPSSITGVYRRSRALCRRSRTMSTSRYTAAAGVAPAGGAPSFSRCSKTARSAPCGPASANAAAARSSGPEVSDDSASAADRSCLTAADAGPWPSRSAARRAPASGDRFGIAALRAAREVTDRRQRREHRAWPGVHRQQPRCLHPQHIHRGRQLREQPAHHQVGAPLPARLRVAQAHLARRRQQHPRELARRDLREQRCHLALRRTRS